MRESPKTLLLKPPRLITHRLDRAYVRPIDRSTRQIVKNCRRNHERSPTTRPVGDGVPGRNDQRMTRSHALFFSKLPLL